MDSHQLALERRTRAKQDRMNRLTKYRRILKREGFAPQPPQDAPRAGAKRARSDEDDGGAADGERAERRVERGDGAGGAGGRGGRRGDAGEVRGGKRRRGEGEEKQQRVLSKEERERQRKEKEERREREREEKAEVRKKESRVMRGKTRFGQPLLSRSIAVLTARIERRNPDLAQHYYADRRRAAAPLPDDSEEQPSHPTG
jgi:hypothetical protein